MVSNFDDECVKNAFRSLVEDAQEIESECRQTKVSYSEALKSPFDELFVTKNLQPHLQELRTKNDLAGLGDQLSDHHFAAGRTGKMNTASQPLVSIVTPVYNEAGHLAECIESVLAQTYQNWDFTIIDNCSTDGSLEIARLYAAKDSRIRIHENKEFLRVIANHNVAIRQRSPESKYSKVVLGDDWIFPNCLEQMVAVAEAHPSVGIVGAYALEGERVALTGLPYPSSLVSGREICRRHLLERLYVFGSANAVLYRSELVRDRDPFYDEANIHADTDVCFALLKTCDFGFVHQVLTFTRVRPDSLTSASKDLQTNLPSMLHLLVNYSADYLSIMESKSRMARHLADYYSFLAKSLLQGRDQKFWGYHKGELAKAGINVSHPRLAKEVLAILCDAALNPQDTVERLLQSRRNRNVETRREVVGNKPRGAAAGCVLDSESTASWRRPIARKS